MNQVALPEPYYDRDGIRIFHARCEDVLPHVDPAEVGLLLTDPPYGIDLKYGGIGDTTKVNARVAGDDEPFDPAPLLRYPRVVMFGANHYAQRLPHSFGWLVWDKVCKNDVGSALSDGELAWTNVSDRLRIFRHMWNGGYRASERGYSVHPTQKPTALMRWIIDRWTAPGDLVLDPYMGSGPIAQACHELGRRYIGCEVVEDYCATAVKRLSQQVLPLEPA